MSTASKPSPPENDAIGELRRQLHVNANRIAEFEAMGAELKLKPRDSRIADMIRINQETVNTFRRSAELLEARLKQAEASVLAPR